MAEESEEREDAGGPTEPGRPQRPRLRRSPLGYRRADVDDALAARDDELAELRQDIAALWLAFAHHDRVLRSLIGEDAADATEPQPVPQPPAPDPGDPPPPARDQPATGAAPSIGEQLSELDEVLAAIEMATRTLEQTYADEIGEARREEPEGSPDAGPARPAD